MNIQTQVAADRSARNPSLLAPLADFAIGLDLANVPEEVLHQAKLGLLDTIGCIVGGADETDSKRIVAAERRPRQGPTARLFCAKERFFPEAAARLNSFLGDVTEHNDLVGSHASIATVPSAMAVADVVGASGADLLRAYIASTEIVTRLYVAYYAWKKPYMDVGIAPPGIINTIGSAAGCALLMGQGHAQVLEAMAIGGGLSGWCPVGAVYDDGALIKPMLHGGWPASIGVLAARYAAGGMTGPVAVLESPMGLFSTLATHYEPNAIVDPGVWHLANPRRKFHSACGYTHAGMDAVASLYREIGAALATAREIVIHVPLYTFRAVSKTAPPATPTELRFHLQFAVALAAVGEDAVRPEHGRNLAEYLARDDIRTILSRIRVAIHERFTHYEQCALDVTLADGTTLHREGLPPRGAPANPLTEAMVKDKFRRNVEARVDAAGAEAYINLIQRIDTLPNLDGLYAPFEPT